jgi:hypothetical protein
MPAVLKELMRHSSINTAMNYYLEQEPDDAGDTLRSALGNTAGNSDQKLGHAGKVAQRGKRSTIRR